MIQCQNAWTARDTKLWDGRRGAAAMSCSDDGPANVEEYGLGRDRRGPRQEPRSLARQIAALSVRRAGEVAGHRSLKTATTRNISFHIISALFELQLPRAEWFLTLLKPKSLNKPRRHCASTLSTSAG